MSRNKPPHWIGRRKKSQIPQKLKAWHRVWLLRLVLSTVDVRQSDACTKHLSNITVLPKRSLTNGLPTLKAALEPGWFPYPGTIKGIGLEPNAPSSYEAARARGRAQKRSSKLQGQNVWVWKISPIMRVEIRVFAMLASGGTTTRQWIGF